MSALRHGVKAGYESGCRCEKCKGWNREKARKYRAAKRAAEGKPPAARVALSTVGVTRAPAAPPRRILGELEKSVADDLTAHAAESPWTATLMATALAFARAIDDDPATVARNAPQLFGVLERLGLTPAAPAKPQTPDLPAGNDLGGLDDDAQFVAGLRTAG